MSSPTPPIGRTNSMDIILEQPKRRVPRQVWVIVGIILFGALVVWGLHTLTQQRGSISVDRATLVTDTARRGEFIRSVSASGTFQPEHVRIVSATQDGIVEQMLVKPGATVNADSIIAVM